MLDRLRRGGTAGIIAGFVVALVVLVHDLLVREPLSTPRLLGRNLLGAPVEGGASGTGALDWLARTLVAGWELAAYSVVHFGAFALFGVLGAWVFRPGRIAGNVLSGALFGLVAGSAMFYAGMWLVAPSFLAAPDWRLVAAMNALAGVVLVSQLVEVAEEGPATDATGTSTD